MTSAWHSLLSPLLLVILLFILQAESRSLIFDEVDAKSLQKHPSHTQNFFSGRYDKRQSYFDSLAGQSLGKRSGQPLAYAVQQYSPNFGSYQRNPAEDNYFYSIGQMKL